MTFLRRQHLAGHGDRSIPARPRSRSPRCRLGTDVLTASYGGNGNFAASSTVIGPNSIITTVAGNGTRGLQRR